MAKELDKNYQDHSVSGRSSRNQVVQVVPGKILKGERGE